jgi:GTPase
MLASLTMSSLDNLLTQFFAGDQRAIARLATLVENNANRAREIIDKVYGQTGRAHVVGITGAPGSGKSTLLRGVLTEVVARGQSAAVVAIDPTSPISNGATLGDRIRLSDVSTAQGIFVRSLASRGRRDGLSPTAVALVQLFDAASFNYVFVETVGAGQDQYEIAGVANTVVLAQIPGTGDSIQLLKAGLMEMADILVVNKSDLPGARSVAHDLRAYLGLISTGDTVWKQPIVLCSSLENVGFDELLNEIDKHQQYLLHTNQLEDRINRRSESEIRRSCGALVEEAIARDPERLGSLVKMVSARQTTPNEAASSIIRSIAATGPD